jgi:hypothetical protein
MSRAGCAGNEGICNTMQKDLIQNFHKKLLGFFDETPNALFAAPSAARMVKGLSKTLNNYVKDASTSTFKISKDNLFVIINCNEQEVQKALQAAVPRDTYKLSLSNNLLDFTMFDPFSKPFKNKVITGVGSKHVIDYLIDAYQYDK